MNDLTPPDEGSNKSLIISPALSVLLASEWPNAEVVEKIVGDSHLTAEAKRLAPALWKRATSPAGEAGVARVVARRFAIFPTTIPPELMDAWWADYYDCLSGIPESALEAGMKAHIHAGGQFMPKPGELRQLALTTPNPAVRAAERAKAVAEYVPPKTYDALGPIAAPKTRQVPTESERHRVHHMLHDYIDQHEARKPPKEPFTPRAQASVDAGGLTAEMRAAIERRQTP